MDGFSSRFLCFPVERRVPLTLICDGASLSGGSSRFLFDLKMSPLTFNQYKALQSLSVGILVMQQSAAARGFADCQPGADSFVDGRRDAKHSP